MLILKTAATLKGGNIEQARKELLALGYLKLHPTSRPVFWYEIDNLDPKKFYVLLNPRVGGIELADYMLPAKDIRATVDLIFGDSNDNSRTPARWALYRQCSH